jgi:hypothetical protein
VWCVVCGVWCVVCGLWFVFQGCILVAARFIETNVSEGMESK